MVTQYVPGKQVEKDCRHDFTSWILQPIETFMTAVTTMSPVEIFLTAARGGTVDRPPVWLMRQAGRYLPEYRALRQQHGFLTLCKTPNLAVEVSLQPWRRFGMDGVVVFSDIMIPVEAMGLGLTIGEGGPKLSPPVTTLQDVEQLQIPDPSQSVPFLLAALRQLRTELQSQACVIGFSGGPWTLATHMISGSGATDRRHCQALLLDDQRFREALFRKLSGMLVPYLVAQANAGAQVLQIFETWAGVLSPTEFEQVVLPTLVQIIADVKSATGGRIPIVIYCNECRHLMEYLGASGADVVSVDWRIPLSEARSRLPKGTALQGNLNPESLLQSPAAIRSAMQTMLVEGGTTGYIANLGHGVLKQTPVESVATFVNAVREYLRAPLKTSSRRKSGSITT